MKKKLSLAFYCSIICFAAFAQNKFIYVSNQLSFAREEIIEIPWQQIVAAYPAINPKSFKVISKGSGKELPYQLEYKEEKTIQNLLIQISIPANGSIKLTILSGMPKPVNSKTYCRYVPERKDDFAWENDRIAFRMYGKELENTPNEMAYGVDVWVKSVSRLIVDERYKRGEYHIDHGDGMDYYHVGLTLGAGGMAPTVKDSIYYSKNYRQWQILDNGPLRTTFKLLYDEWIVDSIKVKAEKTISLNAGLQLNKTRIKYTYDNKRPLSVVAGIIKRTGLGEIWLNEASGILSYWEPRNAAKGTTGVACIFNSAAKMRVDQTHLIGETNTDQNGLIEYFHGAAWDKAGKIISAKEWNDYLFHFKQRLQNPIQIQIR